MSRYYYPDGGARWMTLDKYPGDHVPIEGEIKEISEILPPDIKEVVIRTDPETCRRYGFDKKKIAWKRWDGHGSFSKGSLGEIPNRPTANCAMWSAMSNTVRKN